MAMAKVTGSRSSASSGKPGTLQSITIEIMANGFQVREDRVPKMGKNGPMWEPTPLKDKMVFTKAGECISYLEKCLGETEHKAHEKSEEK